MHPLLKTKINNAQIEDLPNAILDMKDAYNQQETFVSGLIEHYGGKIIGYKVACTNKKAQDFLKLNEPFYGNLISSFTYTTPAKLNLKDFSFRCIELEFGFEIGKDLPFKKTPYKAEEVQSAISGIIPSIEIVDSRFTDWLKVNSFSLIVDNACHGAWIKGEICKSWKQIDLSDYKTSLFVNGGLKAIGNSSNIMGNPINALTWLANKLHQRNKFLKAGDLITTGISNEIYFSSSAEEIIGDFGDLGKVKINFI